MADWRYPFNPGLNQTANLPSSFGPPNQSSQIQGALGSFMDPILAKILQQQATERAQNINEKLITLGDAYKPGTAAAAPAAPGAAAPVSPAPGVAAANAGSPAGDDATAVMGGGASAVKSSEVRDKFMGELEAGGLKNPYGLAAMAATGQRESGWSMGNVNRTWADGRYPSGGALSWNGPRLRNMQAFTAGAEDPVVAQAQFALAENPKLIAQLNAARSPEEANELMANAWRYKGYDRDSPEFRARENLTRAYARKFEQAPAPQAAPQTAFAPNVAPAPTPQAAAAVTAPAGPQAQPYAPAYMDAATGGGINPNDPRVNPAVQGRPVPGRPAPQAGPAPQAQAPQQAVPQEQTQVSEAEAKQQEVIANVGQGTQQLQQRLDAERQAGQRTRVASLDPSVGISPALPNIGLGEGMPGMGGTPGGAPGSQTAAIASPPLDIRPPPQQPPPPPPPAQEPPVVAPGGATAGPQPPPAPRPAVEPPVRVAQAQIIPPTVTDQRGQRPISNEQARELLRMAKTPEEVAAVAQHIMKTREAPAMVPNRFRLENGFWIDSLTGETKSAGGRAADVKGRDTVEVNGARYQWNPATERYDIPVGGPAPANAPPTKEQFDQEYKLRDKFESDPETRRYAVATNAYGQMRSSANSGNGVGDISLIYQYMKMLDPDTGVREGEYANASQVGGLPDRVVNVYNKMVTGERLSDKQRKDFVDEAGRLLEVRHGNVSKAAEKVRRNAVAYRLDPDRVAQIDEYKFAPWSSPIDPATGKPRSDPGGADPERAATALGTPANPIPIPDDPKAAQKTLRAMPSKKWFIMPDGTVSQKP